jgi:hypothetical protein
VAAPDGDVAAKFGPVQNFAVSLPSKQTPVLGIDADNDELRIARHRAFFAKNVTFEPHRGTTAPGSGDRNSGVITPMDGNRLLYEGILPMPAGRNQVVGFYESVDTAEAFVWVWNSNRNHLLFHINGRNAVRTPILRGACLALTNDPRHFIGDGRVVVYRWTRVNPLTDTTETVTFLKWVDNREEIRFCCVEDCIATGGLDYNTYPRLEPKGVPLALLSDERCRRINLGVPTPMPCTTVLHTIKRIPKYKGKPNQLINRGWQWRVKYIDVYDRESEHGPISDRYFLTLGSSCINLSKGQPRSLRLRIPAGGPLVAKIQVEFRTCAGVTQGAASDWYLYDTIEAYEPCTDVPWYERTINNPWTAAIATRLAAGMSQVEAEEDAEADGITRYNSADHTFEYTFSGDKDRAPIDLSETIRTENDLPETASGVMALNRGIAVSNTVRGKDPLDCDEVAKINFTVGEGSMEGECEEPELREVTVYAFLWNVHVGSGIAPPGGFGRIYHEFANDGLYSFGSRPLVYGLTNPHNAHNAGHQQFFPQYQKGWVGYLAGTKYWTVSEQVLVYTDTMEEVVYDQHTQINQSRHYMWLQRFKFKGVPGGKYLFRVSNHFTSPKDDYQKTSAWIKGQTPKTNLAQILTGTAQWGAITSDRKELDVDCRNGDVVNHTTYLQIADITSSLGIGKMHFSMWYIRESGANVVPIERAPIQQTAGPQRFITPRSDHNGFVWGWWYDDGQSGNVGGSIGIYITAGCNVAPHSHIFDTHIHNSALYFQEFKNNNFDRNTYTLITTAKPGNEPYPDGARRIISGRIHLCGQPESGIPGALVVMRHGATAVSDADGNWKIIAHERSGADASAGDVIIYSQSSAACQLYRCDSCDQDWSDEFVGYKDCNYAPNRNTVLPPVQRRIYSSRRKGPQNGGRYRLGLICHDWVGRHGAVQSLPKHYVDIPTLAEKEAFRFSQIGFNIDPSIVLPPWVRRISFAITRNLNWDDFMMWIVDRVDFVDGAGNPNSVAPSQIRIYYESLSEYNTLHNFGTTTAWQFIENQEAAARSVAGDIIEFVQNGNGNWYDENTSAQVVYDKEGRYIQIEYTDALKDLESGALIRLVRSRNDKADETFNFNELCPVIDVVNGKPVTLSGTFGYADSYMLHREIPVPQYQTDPNDPTKILRTVGVKHTSYLFEHPSPSDFWGHHCRTFGRAMAMNPYERKRRYGSEVARSKALLRNGNFNGLSYFDRGADATQFDQRLNGDITVGLAETSVVLLLCERDTYTVAFDDDGLRIVEGAVVGGGGIAQFGKPQRKIGDNYGCMPLDVASIKRSEGLVRFVDRTRAAVVYHDFNQARDVSEDGAYKSWMADIIAGQNAFNVSVSHLPGHLRGFRAGYDPATKEYLLTAFATSIVLGGREPSNWDLIPPIWINDDATFSIWKPQTFVLDGRTGILKQMAALAPEAYGSLGEHVDGRLLLAFKDGHAWIHHLRTELAIPYANFFGVQCKQRIGLVWNDAPEKVKRFLHAELYLKGPLMVGETIETEAGQVSRLAPAHWDRREGFFTADFKCALNTPVDPNLPTQTGVNVLLDGDPLYGRWLKVMFCSAEGTHGQYRELSAAVAYFIGSESSAD